MIAIVVPSDIQDDRKTTNSREPYIGHSQKDQNWFSIGYRLMQAKSTAECSKVTCSILQSAHYKIM